MESRLRGRSQMRGTSANAGGILGEALSRGIDAIFPPAPPPPAREPFWTPPNPDQVTADYYERVGKSMAIPELPGRRRHASRSGLRRTDQVTTDYYERVGKSMAIPELPEPPQPPPPPAVPFDSAEPDQVTADYYERVDQTMAIPEIPNPRAMVLVSARL